jgi:hypothetical protein
MRAFAARRESGDGLLNFVEMMHHMLDRPLWADLHNHNAEGY